MLERAKIALATQPSFARAEDSVLLDHLSETNIRIQNVLESIDAATARNYAAAQAICSSRSVYRGDEALRSKLLNYAETPTIGLDDILSEVFKKQFGAEGYDAYYFLKETFYQITTYTPIANWIFWGALESDYGVDPYAPVFELYKISAQAGWNEEEMFVFQLEA